MLLAALGVMAKADIPDEFPLFEIDLALPPKERFAAVSKHYSQGIVATMNSFIGEYPLPA